LSDGVVDVGRVVVVTGAGSELESVCVCPETVADGVQKLEAEYSTVLETFYSLPLLLQLSSKLPVAVYR